LTFLILTENMEVDGIGRELLGTNPDRNSYEFVAVYEIFVDDQGLFSRKIILVHQDKKIMFRAYLKYISCQLNVRTVNCFVSNTFLIMHSNKSDLVNNLELYQSV